MSQTLHRFNAGFLSARIGEWMYVVALNWIVLEQTQSAWLLAVINACRLLPSLLLSVPAGTLADRKDPRRLSYVNNLANAAVMVMVGLALHFGLPMAAVAALVLLQAVLTAVEAPFRNTYMNSLFEGVRLKQAIAQSASLMNLGRIIGPALAGCLLAYLGGLPTFLLGALFTAIFSAVIRTLTEGSAVPPRKAPKGPPIALGKVLRENAEIRSIMLLAVPMMFFGFPYTAMLSVLTDTMLGLGAEELGFLTAVSAAGALAASSWLGLKPEHATWGATLRYALLFALSLCLLGAVQGIGGAAVALFFVGYLGQAYRSCSRMHLHEVVPKSVAGRVIGLSLMDRGMIPLGGLALGALTEFSSARVSFALMGVGCLFSVAFFLPALRRWIPKVAVAFTLVTSLFLTVCGCQAPPTAVATPEANSTAGETVSVEHAWGKAQIAKAPRTIVVLDLPYLDGLTALGQPVAGYAGTSEKALPEYLASKVKALGAEPAFVGERKQPNLEVLMSLKPDLIVANPSRHAMIRPQLEGLAPTVAYDDDSLSDVQAMLKSLAEITGREEALKDLEAGLQKSIAATKAAQSGSPRVLVVGSFEDEFSTWTKASFIGTLLDDVGASYAFDGPPTPSEGKAEVAKLTLESLAELNPDVLFVYGDPSRWEQNPIYRGLKAVREGRVSKVDRDLWARSRGPLAALAILSEYEKFLTQSAEVSTAPAR